ncbi:hypothetical protein AGMMS49525_10180 [Bacteroidia bacterium]|nr:hypothetical protein AGMMS49525_10180 [Bacteroidia bacterium]
MVDGTGIGLSDAQLRADWNSGAALAGYYNTGSGGYGGDWDAGGYWLISEDDTKICYASTGSKWISVMAPWGIYHYSVRCVRTL